MSSTRPARRAESVYNLCELEWVCRQFGDNIALKVMVAKKHIEEKTPEKSYAAITKLAAEHGVRATIDGPEALARVADEVFTKAALYSSMRIVEKVEAYAAPRGKKVLYVLSYSGTPVAKTLRGEKRFDQDFVDFLNKKRLSFVDLMEAHRADYSTFKNKRPEDYAKLYWIGHYNPRGNLFTAFAVRDELVPLLEPKPRMYNEKLTKLYR